MFEKKWNEFLKIKVHPRQRLKTLLSDVDVQVRMNGKVIGQIGAGSISALGRIKHLQESSSFVIGRFCQVNATSDILVGGEHSIFNHINNSFSGVPLLHANVSKDHLPQMTSKGHTVIGNGVIVGAKCVILSGSEIGDGCIVGASSLCIKKYPEFSILGGVPADIIAARPESCYPVNHPYWNFKLPTIYKILSNKLKIENTSPQHLRRSESSVVLEIDTRDGKFSAAKVTGIVLRQELISIESLSRNFQVIFGQVPREDEVIIISNDMDELLHMEAVKLNS